MISLVRIDDRLIHGQVATQWIAEVSANTIVIVDDETANDEFVAMVCKGMAPLHTEVFVCNEKDGLEKLKEVEKDDSIRAIVLVKVPGTILRLLENGVNIQKVILGGIGKKEDRKVFYKSIHASNEEIEEFKKLIQCGVEVNVQMVPSDSSVPVTKLID